jgi:hypothetical protein
VLVLIGGVSCTDHSSGTTAIGQSDPGNTDNRTTPGNTGNPLDPVDPIVRQPDPAAPQPGEPIPEPGTMLLLGTGLAGAAVYHRRRQRRKHAEQTQA